MGVEAGQGGCVQGPTEQVLHQPQSGGFSRVAAGFSCYDGGLQASSYVGSKAGICGGFKMITFQVAGSQENNAQASTASGEWNPNVE